VPVRALLIVVLVATILSPPATGADGALTLDWVAVDRLVDRDFDGTVDGAFTPDRAASAVGAVRVSVRGAGECEGELEWRLDDEEVTPTRVRRCTFELPVDEGTHQLVLEAGGREASQDLDVRDHLVVSIGDSVASGEGNPDSGGLADPNWLETRCHRSMRSGAAQAAVALDRGNPNASVSFVPLGCSGATVRRGLLPPREYRGIQPNREQGPLPPQVQELVTLAEQRPIDAVLMNVGANDVHFGSLVIFCAAVKDCSQRRFDPSSPYRESPNPSTDTAAEVIERSLGQLRESYRDLGAALREHVPDDRVIAVEYFNPLRDAGGEQCLSALPGIDSAEAAWAESAVLRNLNEELRLAAEENRWRLVTGVANVFRDHGICAEGEAAWVRRLGESFPRQADLNGTLHPNGRGHLATAALIAPVLATTLGEDVGTGLAHLAGEPEGEDHGKVDWWWLIVAAMGGSLAGALVVLLVVRLLGPRSRRPAG
jgi:GDSL-like Lipase/Acylhydrolase family